MRNSDDPPISLFSFQDIITTISGIMILVVLMLILDIISNPIKSENLHSAIISNEELLKAEQNRDIARQLLAEEKKRNAENEAILSKTRNADLGTILKKISEEETMKQKLEADANKIAESLDSAKDKLKKHNELLQSAKNNDIITSDNINEEINSATQKLAATEQAVEEEKIKLKRQQRRIKFTVTGESNKKIMLVECSNNKIAAQIYGSTKIYDFTSRKPTMDDSIEKFLGLVRKLDRSEYFLVMLYKPSSIGYIEFLQRDLEKTGFDLSKEPVEEDVETLGGK